MKTLSAILFCVVSSGFFANAAVAASDDSGKTAGGHIYVSPAGDDANPGTLQEPVARLVKAVELARALPADKPRRVLLRAGDYFDANITLASEDSNLTIESAGDGSATLIGGVVLSGWEKQGERFWSAPLPAGRDWDVRMLQVGGHFCPRARFPEKGTLKHLSVFDVKWRGTYGGGWARRPTVEELTTMKYKEGDIPADLDLNSAEVTVFHMWDDTVTKIVKNDEVTATLTFSPRLGYPPGAFGTKTYCLWNLKEGMTQPGQWYFDRTAHRIVYWPLAGEDMHKATAIVPTRRFVIRLAGAKNVTLRNFSVAVTTVPLVAGGFAARNFDGAVQLERADGAVLSGLHVANVAGQGINGRGRQDSVRVENCDVSNCGAGGVYVRGSQIAIRNNLIHDVGLMFPAAAGIHGGDKHCLIARNEIFNTPYSAMIAGGDDLVIERNLIYRCMQVLHDGAAIYTSSGKRHVIRNNVARDIVDTGGYGASAYYLDEHANDSVVEGNISLNVARPFLGHISNDDALRNNVFITNGDMELAFANCERYTVQSNVLYAKGKITFNGVNAVTEWSKNVVHSAAGKVVGTSRKAYTTTGTAEGAPAGSETGDPLFVDLAKGDLQYKPGSPAVKLGLKPLDLSQAGRE